MWGKLLMSDIDMPPCDWQSQEYKYFSSTWYLKWICCSVIPPIIPSGFHVFPENINITI